MKKIWSLFLTLLVLTSCGAENNQPQETTDRDTTNIENVTTTQPTGNHTAESILPSVCDTQPADSFCFDNEGDYALWLSENKESLPKGFVTYEMVNQMFQGYHFKYFSRMGGSHPNYYSYVIKNAKTEELLEIGIEYKVIENNKILNKNRIEKEKIRNSNMRILAEKESGIYVDDNDMVYKYYEGKLQDLSLLYRGTQVTFCTLYRNVLDVYPAKGGSVFLTSLLDTNTSEKAIDQWKTMIDEALAK